MKVVCFGAGAEGKKAYKDISSRHEILAFLDNDVNKQGKDYCGIPILPPKKILESPFKDCERIFITSTTAYYPMYEQLLELGVPKEKISTDLVDLTIRAWLKFLENFSKLDGRFSANAACAEAGVYEGEFAKYINKFFPNRTLHLFDTFAGFDERDIIHEVEFSDAKFGDLSNKSEELVMNKMIHPEKVVIHKGYFPSTAVGVDDVFCFVNLDMDLFQPTLEGLKFFSKRMEHGGVILVHDFFTERYHGVKKAIEDFMKTADKNLNYFPIGDDISIMITGF